MRNILYILSQDPSEKSGSLLLSGPDPNQQVSILLIQEGVRNERSLHGKCFVLKEDAQARGVFPLFPLVSYADMLRMILQADTVVAI